jgi:hypothetical protein
VGGGGEGRLRCQLDKQGSLCAQHAVMQRFALLRAGECAGAGPSQPGPSLLACCLLRRRCCRPAQPAPGATAACRGQGLCSTRRTVPERAMPGFPWPPLRRAAASGPPASTQQGRAHTPSAGCGHAEDFHRVRITHFRICLMPSPHNASAVPAHLLRCMGRLLGRLNRLPLEVLHCIWRLPRPPLLCVLQRWPIEEAKHRG